MYSFPLMKLLNDLFHFATFFTSWCTAIAALVGVAPDKTKTSPLPLSQAFTVVAVFNSMTFALKVTPLAVRSLSEGAVAVKRFQVRDTERRIAMF